MNKYQKQALVDMGKVAGTVLLAILAFAGVVKLGMGANELVGALSIAAMCYCVYQLYLIRVGQLESEDKRAEMDSRYK
jgi:hypothetical protein